MKKNLLFTILLFAAFVTSYGQSGLCSVSYWNQTYANARLKIYDSCMTITGVVKYEIPPSGLFGTGDGDYHIYILPDTQYSWMVSYRDTNYLKLCEGSDSGGYRLICIPCLNVEEVCKGAPTDAGAQASVDSACHGVFNDSIYLPNVGEYVRCSGPFIYDTVHCWNELHPISYMVVVNPSYIPEVSGSSFLDGMKVFPQPANNEVEFHFEHAPHAVTLVKFYNAQGRQLFVYALAETNDLYLNVENWPSGSYPYAIVSQEQGKLLKSGVMSVVH